MPFEYRLNAIWMRFSSECVEIKIDPAELSHLNVLIELVPRSRG